MGHLRRSALERLLNCAAGILFAVAAVLPDVASAQKSPAASTQSYVLVAGSTFQRGCFEPCMCPISQEQPLVGTFSLSFRSDNGLFAEYDLHDVRWKVEGGVYATPPDAAITGAGSYTIGGEVALQQRMQAELKVGDEASAPFDSGLVAGGAGFPDQIDIEISKNGKYCFDTVLHVVAKAQPVKVCGGIAGIPCDAGEFCKTQVGECCCDFQGICTSIPDACIAQWDPVCGCDGLTYGNECEADRAGVSIDHRGACGGDADGDGLPDQSDNCPHRANAGQADSGGIGTNTPDGIGNACQCGDVTGDGRVVTQDAHVVKRFGLGDVSPLFTEPGNCDVTGNGSCNGQDAKMIQRAVQGASSVVPAQKCQNANPAAPVCLNCTP